MGTLLKVVEYARLKAVIYKGASARLPRQQHKALLSRNDTQHYDAFDRFTPRAELLPRSD